MININQDRIERIDDPSVDQQADPDVVKVIDIKYKELQNADNLNSNNYNLKLRELEVDKHKRTILFVLSLIILISFFCSILIDLYFYDNKRDSDINFIVTDYFFKILPILMLIVGININYNHKTPHRQINRYVLLAYHQLSSRYKKYYLSKIHCVDYEQLLKHKFLYLYKNCEKK